MSAIELISLTLMGAVYCLAGIFHFRRPEFFIGITPKWVPYPERVNVIVGVIEITLGVALFFSFTRHYAAMGIIALLLAVFPANIYHFQKAKQSGKQVIPTLLRLPVQILLIYWAYTFV